jgi:putative FmdB family regulatory protein
VPLYEYRCKQCGHQFEKIQSFSAPEEKVCPACGGEVERLISAPAFQFKGAGWYVNDYAAKGNTKSASGSKEGSSESKPAAESKPATSSESGSKSAASASTKSE